MGMPSMHCSSTGRNIAEQVTMALLCSCYVGFDPAGLCPNAVSPTVGDEHVCMNTKLQNLVSAYHQQ